MSRTGIGRLPGGKPLTAPRTPRTRDRAEACDRAFWLILGVVDLLLLISLCSGLLLPVSWTVR